MQTSSQEPRGEMGEQVEAETSSWYTRLTTEEKISHLQAMIESEKRRNEELENKVSSLEASLMGATKHQQELQRNWPIEYSKCRIFIRKPVTLLKYCRPRLTKSKT